MNLSKWHVSSQGNIRKAGQADTDRRLHIVCLDDHRLFHTAIAEYCIRPFFAPEKLELFTNGDVALSYIKNQIDLRNRIDLFITDINHPGLKGDELIKRIREHESENVGSIRIPIMVITMMEYAFVPGLVGAGISLVDSYFSKTAEPENIVEGIEELLYE